MIVTGRTLDGKRGPIPGTGFEFDEDGWLADLLSERAGPVRSHPTRGTWSAPLQTARGEGDQLRVLSIFAPGYEGPPEHYHQVSEERFDVRQGTFTFGIAGARRAVSAGETLTVETGTRHTFDYDGDELGVSVTVVEPPGRIGHVLPTFAGIAHDERRSEDDPLQRAIIAKRLADDTVFTERASPLADVAVDVLAALASLRGYQAAYARYRQPVFWEQHVEQPEL